MRTVLLSIIAVALAGCASVPASNTATNKVYDQKYGTVRYVATAPAPDFVGTSAKPSTAKAKPAWSAFGHP